MKTNGAPACSLVAAVNAGSKSSGLRAFRICSDIPNDLATGFSAFSTRAYPSLAGFPRMATREILGPISLSKASPACILGNRPVRQLP